MLRSIKETDLVGKTIKSIEHVSINVLTLFFTDDTSLEIWVETAVHTRYGDIPGILVDDKVKAI